MGSLVSTNQSINKYYDLYRDSEVVFTKDIIRLLRIDLRQVYVKCGGNQWPCLINSTSFQMAKVILGTTGGAYQEITKKDAPPVNLRFCFVGDDGNPIYFFVTCHTTEVQQYDEGKGLAIVTLSFTQRPPDDLIFKLGTLIDVNHSFAERKDVRVPINEASLKSLGLEKKEMTANIQNVPRNCILWDIGFAGIKILVMGIANFLKDKDCVLKFEFIDPDEDIEVKGKILSAEPFEGRKDICQVEVQFIEEEIPFLYKVRINNHFTNQKK